jgi:hypothetical protein
MAKIVVGSPSLTQPLLLYPGLGPAMLDNIDGVNQLIYSVKLKFKTSDAAEQVDEIKKMKKCKSGNNGFSA